MSIVNALKRDPILKIYAVDFLDRRRRFYLAVSNTFNRARRSVERSGHTTVDDSRSAYTAYWDAERTIYSGNFFESFDEVEVVAKRIDEAKATNEQLKRSTRAVIRARNQLTRHTNIDRELEVIKQTLLVFEQDLEVLNEAISGDASAKKQVYDRVLGERLDQLDAPYLFDVINFLVELLAPAPVDTSASAAEALALLTKQATEVAERLEKTNVDRRFASTLREYVDVLIEQNFSPIKVELFSNKLRAHLFELKDELPGFAIAEVSALLLSQEQVLRQFPVWRTFEADASQYTPDKNEVEKQRSILENITSETEKADGAVSEEVVNALNRLEESSHSGTAKNTTELGIWRSLENFIKINLKHLIVSSRNVQEYASKNQARYLRYVERLLPHLKLYVTMKENLNWLLPVVHWLEEYIKSVRKP